MSLLMKIQSLLQNPEKKSKCHWTKQQGSVWIWDTAMSPQYHNSYDMSETTFIWKGVSLFSNLQKNCPGSAVCQIKCIRKSYWDYYLYWIILTEMFYPQRVISVRKTQKYMITIGVDQLFSNSAMYEDCFQLKMSTFLSFSGTNIKPRLFRN